MPTCKIFRSNSYLEMRIFALFIFPIHIACGFVRPVRYSHTVNWQLAASNEPEPDLFEYFDPLLSPHSYPNGVGPQHKPVKPEGPSRKRNESSRRTNIFGFDVSESEAEGSADVSSKNSGGDRPMVDPVDTFDPTLSPHAYPNGVPDIIVGDKDATYVTAARETRKTIGILLMDHGSRSDIANQRLEVLAKLYEESVGSPQVIVRAAHMEIASPSIEEGIARLVAEGVHEIVCHPFFLSPGRHVQEDIPRLVQQAVESQNVKIPVLTTDPVGSNTQQMIAAIHTLVEGTSSYYSRITKRPN